MTKNKNKLLNFDKFRNKFPNTFGNNVVDFINGYGEFQKYRIKGMRVWKILFAKKSKSMAVPLFVVEKEVKNAPNPFCNYCKLSGWSDHFLSKNTYNFVIPRESFWNNQLDTDIQFEDSLLCATIHCNGFGHLVSINGIDGGSEYLSGKEIMNFFDNLCDNLSVRSIDVIDTSEKWSTPSRLVYGILYGKSWFGSWGYKFSQGCFGVKENDFLEALSDVSSMRVDDLCLNQENSCDTSGMISCNRDLTNLPRTNVRDLLKHILLSMTEDKALSHVSYGFDAKSKKDLQGYLHKLYHRLCVGQTNKSVQLILENNRVVKEWPVEDFDMNMRYVGYVRSTSDGISWSSSPGDLVVVPLTSCYDDLKKAAQNSFRNTYCMLEKFNVTSLANEASFNLDDDDWIACLQHGSKLWVTGSGVNLDTNLKYQGGPTLSNVQCRCGARNYDGKQMATCLRCNLDQHLKCNNIEDESAFPPLFLCQACCRHADHM